MSIMIMKLSTVLFIKRWQASRRTEFTEMLRQRFVSPPTFGYCFYCGLISILLLAM